MESAGHAIPALQQSVHITDTSGPLRT